VLVAAALAPVLALAPLPAGAADTISTASLTAHFADRQITPDQTSVLTFTITNDQPRPMSGLGFRQPMPTNLEVSSYGLRKNCGSPTVTGVHTLKVARVLVAPNAVCTIEVVVLPAAEGTFEVSPQKDATITGDLIPGQGDVLRVRTEEPCADPAAVLCAVGVRPTAPN
jgi:hypothetical protein